MNQNTPPLEGEIRNQLNGQQLIGYRWSSSSGWQPVAM
jgi:hypothetical protein